MDYHLSSDYISTASLGPDTRIIDSLNKVLRGEISAVEAYAQVMDRFATEPEIHRLLAIKEEHEDSVKSLRAMVANEGAVPSEDSGLWGTIVKGVVATGKLFGNTSALNAIKQGEEHGLRQYKDLMTLNLSADDLRVIKSKLIPRQEKHIALLDQLATMQ